MAKNDKSAEAAGSDKKQLLVLIDTDMSGKVSKTEFMAFIEKEFDRLDINQDGVLDIHELTQYYSHRSGGTHRLRYVAVSAYSFFTFSNGCLSVMRGRFSACSCFDTASTSLNTRMKFPPRILLQSAAL